MVLTPPRFGKRQSPVVSDNRSQISNYSLHISRDFADEAQQALHTLNLNDSTSVAGVADNDNGENGQNPGQGGLTHAVTMESSRKDKDDDDAHSKRRQSSASKKAGARMDSVWGSISGPVVRRLKRDSKGKELDKYVHPELHATAKEHKPFWPEKFTRFFGSDQQEADAAGGNIGRPDTQQHTDASKKSKRKSKNGRSDSAPLNQDEEKAGQQLGGVPATKANSLNGGTADKPLEKEAALAKRQSRSRLSLENHREDSDSKSFKDLLLSRTQFCDRLNAEATGKTSEQVWRQQNFDKLGESSKAGAKGWYGPTPEELKGPLSNETDNDTQSNQRVRSMLDVGSKDEAALHPNDVSTEDTQSSNTNAEYRGSYASHAYLYSPDSNLTFDREPTETRGRSSEPQSPTYGISPRSSVATRSDADAHPAVAAHGPNDPNRKTQIIDEDEDSPEWQKYASHVARYMNPDTPPPANQPSTPRPSTPSTIRLTSPIDHTGAPIEMPSRLQSFDSHLTQDNHYPDAASDISDIIPLGILRHPLSRHPSISNTSPPRNRPVSSIYSTATEHTLSPSTLPPITTNTNINVNANLNGNANGYPNRHAPPPRFSLSCPIGGMPSIDNTPTDGPPYPSSAFGSPVYGVDTRITTCERMSAGSLVGTGVGREGVEQGLASGKGKGDGNANANGKIRIGPLSFGKPSISSGRGKVQGSCVEYVGSGTGGGDGGGWKGEGEGEGEGYAQGCGCPDSMLGTATNEQARDGGNSGFKGFTRGRTKGFGMNADEAMSADAETEPSECARREVDGAFLPDYESIVAKEAVQGDAHAGVGASSGDAAGVGDWERQGEDETTALPTPPDTNSHEENASVLPMAGKSNQTTPEKRLRRKGGMRGLFGRASEGNVGVSVGLAQNRENSYSSTESGGETGGAGEDIRRNGEASALGEMTHAHTTPTTGQRKTIPSKDEKRRWAGIWGEVEEWIRRGGKTKGRL